MPLPKKQHRALSRDDPWLRRFAAWAEERFPPVQAILFFLLYMLALLFGRSLGGRDALSVGAADLAGFFAFYAFFFMLRAIDEHKDYEDDCRNHPARVLQRGLIRLRDLKLLAAAAVVLQGGFSLWLDRGFGPVTAVWLAVMAWSALMTVEFFARGWLRRRLLLYAACHLLVMPLVLAWAAAMGSAAGVGSRQIAVLAALGFFSGFLFEVTRKIRAPEDEQDGVDSYSKILGNRGAARLVVALLAVVDALLWILTAGLSDGVAAIPGAVALGALFVLGSWPAVAGSEAPTRRRAKRLETAAIGSVLLGYLVFIAALISVRGLVWTGFPAG